MKTQVPMHIGSAIYAQLTKAPLAGLDQFNSI